MGLCGQASALHEAAGGCTGDVGVGQLEGWGRQSCSGPAMALLRVRPQQDVATAPYSSHIQAHWGPTLSDPQGPWEGCTQRGRAWASHPAWWLLRGDSEPRFCLPPLLPHLLQLGCHRSIGPGHETPALPAAAALNITSEGPGWGEASHSSPADVSLPAVQVLSY